MTETLTSCIALCIDTWNEEDSTRRAELIAAWTVDASSCDALPAAEAHDGLSEMVANVHGPTPAPGSAGRARSDVHHDHLRFAWDLGAARRRGVRRRLDVGEVAADGRLRRITRFFGELAPAPAARGSLCDHPGKGRLPAVIVDCAIYEGGERQGGRVPVEAALDQVRSSGAGFVWIGLHEPNPEEFHEITEEFGLHPLAVEDAVHAHQRPKVETYGDTVFVVLKAARYVDSDEVIEFSQIMVFLGSGFLITVRHGQTDLLADVRREIVDAPEELKCGPIGVLHAIIDRVVDDYAVVLRSLDADIDEVEQQVFSSTRANLAERIYKLKREVLEFRQAVLPLAEPLEELAAGRLPHTRDAPREYFRDVHDHVLRTRDRVEAVDALLTSVLSANLAQVGVRQNEDMRKISAWVAIIAMPTMIAGVYGMNFEHMPELGWLLGYPFALTLMVASCLTLYVVFRRRDWL